MEEGQTATALEQAQTANLRKQETGRQLSAAGRRPQLTEPRAMPGQPDQDATELAKAMETAEAENKLIAGWDQYRELLVAMAQKDPVDPAKMRKVLVSVGRSPESFGIDVQTMRARLDADKLRKRAIDARGRHVELLAQRQKLFYELETTRQRILDELKALDELTRPVSQTAAQYDPATHVLLSRVIDPRNIAKHREMVRAKRDAEETRRRCLVATDPQIRGSLARQLEVLRANGNPNASGYPEEVARIEGALLKKINELADASKVIATCDEVIARLESERLIP
jgi:hypothetical protein